MNIDKVSTATQYLEPVVEFSDDEQIPSSGSNHIMEEMFASLNKLYEERNEAFNEKFGIKVMDQPKKTAQPLTDDDQDLSDVVCNPKNLKTPVESVTKPMKTVTQAMKSFTINDEVPQKTKSVSQDMDMMEPQKQAKDITVRQVVEPLFCSGKELTPGAWELIRQSREIYAGRGMIQDSYKQYNSQLAEELRMNHHFSNFTVEKNTGEKRKM